MMGSPYYMSPEQMRSPKDVDARTDIWALGVVLYELLTKSVPFQGDTQAEVCVKIVTEPPPPVRDFRPEIPEGLQAVILTCLAKDRKNRYRNIAEMAVALLPFGPRQAKATVEKVIGIIQAAGLSATAVSVPPTPNAPRSQPSSHTIAPVGNTVFRSARGKVAVLSILGVLGAGAVSVAAVIGLRAQRGGDQRPHDNTPVAAANHFANDNPPPAAVPPPPPLVEKPVAAPVAESQPVAAVLKSDPAPTASVAPSRTVPRAPNKAAPRGPVTVASAAAAASVNLAGAAPASVVAAMPPAVAAVPPAVPAAPPVAPSAPSPTPSDPLQNLRLKK
jgi:serine/threonine-protein kinase